MKLVKKKKKEGAINYLVLLKQFFDLLIKYFEILYENSIHSDNLVLTGCFILSRHLQSCEMDKPSHYGVSQIIILQTCHILN